MGSQRASAPAEPAGPAPSEGGGTKKKKKNWERAAPTATAFVSNEKATHKLERVCGVLLLC